MTNSEVLAVSGCSCVETQIADNVMSIFSDFKERIGKVVHVNQTKRFFCILLHHVDL
jgi:hypothetical protein